MNDDDELNERMRRARPRLEFPPDFQREIWSRIEAADIQSPVLSWALLGQWMRWVARPVPAVAFSLLMLGAGCLLAALGAPPGDHRREHAGYLESVSPFAAAKLDNRR